MKLPIIDTFERRALLPISRGYAIILSFISIVVFVGSLFATVYFHVRMHQSADAIKIPSLSIDKIDKKLAPPVAPVSGRNPAAESKLAQSKFVESLSDLDQALIKLSVAADPDKKIEYFTAFEKGQKLARECGGAFAVPFIQGLANVVSQYNQKHSEYTLDQISVAFCDLWRSNIRHQQSVISTKAVESSEAEGYRSIAFYILVGSLVSVAMLALPIALLAIERNTRATELLVQSLRAPALDKIVLAGC